MKHVMQRSPAHTQHIRCPNPRPEIIHFLKTNPQALAALQTERTTTKENALALKGSFIGSCNSNAQYMAT
jgi:hypothetical protein